MTCMVALPDGTYMIMNGAQQGVAGFGLATDPNLQALLYDPSQPVGQRISILSTTIVDRLYHSEAILLHDGRVLVSGSDPEDTRFPQEYRVEVYIPPYLSSGLKQPTFTISGTDWTYGSSHQITMQLFQGSTSGMRVSLISGIKMSAASSLNCSDENFQLCLAHTEIAWVSERSSRPSHAQATRVRSPHLPTPTSAPPVGSNSSSWMVRHPRSRNGYGSAAIQHNWVYFSSRPLLAF